MDDALRNTLQSFGDSLARQEGQVMALIQAVTALVATHPNKAAFGEAYARYEVRAPIPDSAPKLMQDTYAEVSKAIELAVMDNSVKGSTP